MDVLEYILSARRNKRKLFAWLIDPDKTDNCLLALRSSARPSLFFVGGSSGGEQTGSVVSRLKEASDVPVVLFPGNGMQGTPKADALLFRSLLSGRNPEMLVGQQVRAAGHVRASRIETIPMGYILVDGGTDTAVARVSGTAPISQHAVDEIVSTAMAAEMMGKSLVYLEAGSGALTPVSAEVIRAVRKAITCPLIVGGGIRSEEMMRRAYDAGADLVVIGNYLEEHPEAAERFVAVAEQMSQTLPPSQDDVRYMGMALEEARKALAADEIPVGCVIVADGRVIGRGHNLTETLQDVTAHAEMQALTAAASTMGGKYLSDAVLYVTVEPCVMCAGAIGWAQVRRVVYGCPDEKRGFMHFAPNALHSKATITSGVLEEDCRDLMQQFFRQRR